MAAISETRSIAEDYTVQYWGVEDGLPEGIITSITQFSDGFVWLTTPRHIVRFDGVEFVAVPQHDFPASKPKRLHSILRDRQGNVWVSGENGVMRFASGAWEVVPLQDEFGMSEEKSWSIETPDGSIQQHLTLKVLGIWERAKGELWAAANRGLYRFDGEVFRLIPPDGSATEVRFISADMDEAGVFWLSGQNGLTAFDGQHYMPHPFPTESGKGRLFRVFAGMGETLWGKRLDGKLFKRVNGEWHESPPFGMRLEALLELPDEVWLGSVEGLNRLADDRSTRLLDIDIPRAQDVRCLKRTVDGSLWVGSGNGLFQLRPRSIQMFPTRVDGQTHAVTALLPAANHTFWIGLANRGLWKGSSATLKPFVVDPPVLNNSIISSILLTRDGLLWVGTRGDHLWRITTKGVIKQFRSLDGYASRHITSLLEDQSGHLWIGSWEGLLRVNAKGWLVNMGEPEDAILTLCENDGGGLWVGTQSSGLFLLSADGTQVLRKVQGLPSETVRVLHHDAEGLLWIATSRGLACLENQSRDRNLQAVAVVNHGEAQPRIFCFTREHGMPDDDIFQILDDGHGVLWVGTRQNLFRIRKQDMLNVAAGRAGVLPLSVFGRDEGLSARLVGGGHSGPLNMQTPGGQLWFATHAGIAMLGADLWDKPFVPPPVYIEKFSANIRQNCSPFSLSRLFSLGDSYATNKTNSPASYSISFNDSMSSSTNALNVTSPMELPADCHDIVFRFTTPCYAAPEQVMFRTRLDGYDNDWSPPGTERHVVYPRLPHGTYTFRLMSAFSEGGWRESEQRIHFVVKPFVWQTAWFKAAVMLLALGLTGFSTGMLFRRRARQKMRAAAKVRAHERELENERARIARDVHDEVGAGLTEIAMLSDWVRRDINATAPHATQDRMTRVCEAAVGLVRSVDGIVWAVNPANDTVERFVNYLTYYAERFLGATGQNFRVTAPSPLPNVELSGAVRHTFFQAVREALNNAVKHAYADSIECDVRIDEGWLRVVVSDDGCGFDVTAMNNDGTREGIGNMRRRMAQASGSVNIDSWPGSGTRVVLSVKIETTGI